MTYLASYHLARPHAKRQMGVVTPNTQIAYKSKRPEGWDRQSLSVRERVHGAGQYSPEVRGARATVLWRRFPLLSVRCADRVDDALERPAVPVEVPGEVEGSGRHVATPQSREKTRHDLLARDTRSTKSVQTAATLGTVFSMGVILRMRSLLREGVAGISSVICLQARSFESAGETRRRDG